MGKLRRIALIGLLLEVFCSPAKAGTLLLDPSTLFIGSGQGTPCATGGCPLIGGELNNYGPSTLDIYQNQNGAKDLANPILLILGVPNNSQVPIVTGASLYAPANTLSSATVSATPGTTAFGLNIPSGFAGLMGPGVSDVYDFIGISQNTNSSNSYTNWANFDQADLGKSFSDFGIYVFALTINPPQFAGQDLINVQIKNVPEGTYAVAYGQDTSHFYDTPFTEAGLMDVPPPLTVPEPSTLALFGAGIIALGLISRRGRRQSSDQTGSQSPVPTSFRS